MTTPASRGSLAVNNRFLRLGGRATLVAYLLAIAGNALITAFPAMGAWVKPLVTLVSAAGAGVLAWAWVSRRNAARRLNAEQAGVPPESPLVHNWRAAHRTVRREMTGRVGPQAASHSSRLGTILRLNRLLYVLSMLIMLASVNLYAAWIDYLWPGLAMLMAIAAMLVTRSWARREAARYARFVADALGPGFPRASMPRSPAEYLAWCAANELEPYPFGRPDWHAGEHSVGGRA